MKNLVLTAIMLVCLMAAKAGEQPYSIGENLTIQSSVLDEERSIIVYTPPGYDLGKQSYPVLYLLDGDTHFHHVSGIIQFLSAQGTIPRMIVVAIPNVNRIRDLSPTTTAKYPKSGGGAKFLGFIGDELMPYMNENYRTNDFDILVGHSLGGAFTTFTLLKRPELFSAYIAISPYLMWDEDFFTMEMENNLKPEYDFPIWFYLTVGNEPDYFKPLADFKKQVESRSPNQINLTYVLMQDENHASIPHLSVYNGLQNIFSGWKLPKDTFIAGLDAIDKHYQSLSDTYGFKVRTPEYTINQLGYYKLNNDEMEKALKVFAENINRYPESANVYDSYGEALERNDQLEYAEKNYLKAVEIARKENHPYLEVYNKNLKRIQDKLAKEAM